MNFMDLKTALKLVFFLFCIISTFQVLSIVLIIGPFFYTHLDRHSVFDVGIYSRLHLLELLSIALASSLPTLVLVQNKFLSRIPLLIRRAVHFFLTFGAVCGLPIYFSWYDASIWLLMPFGVFLIIYVLVFFFFDRYTQVKRTAQQNAKKQKQLQYYTEELERYQLDVRKFQHDYQNILLSLDTYIADGNLAGLRQYYSSSLKPVSDSITKTIFTLDSLDKIKVRAIKSSLAAKFISARSTSADIHIIFEANEEIDYIPLNSVALVRMLGILLDNAIEELAELGRGELFVSCLKWGAGITFVVQNTCRPNLPPSQQLWQVGFSTKEKSKDRGLGLPNLSELVAAYPNVTLSTKINKNSFRQELLIENLEGNDAT